MSKDMKCSKKTLIKAYGKFKSKPSNENNKEYISAQKSHRGCQRRCHRGSKKMPQRMSNTI